MKPIWTVDQITHAYEVLSDGKRRREYDDKLLNAATITPNGQTDRHRTTELYVLDLDDMSFDDEKAQWSKACRCGNAHGFLIGEDELEELISNESGSRGEVLLACEDCSHHIKVLFAVGEEEDG